MIYTAGIFLFQKHTTNMLIVHPTNASDDMWSIPKGECSFDFERNMYRELYEETNILIPELYKSEVTYVGNYPYKDYKKCLVAFCAKIPYYEIQAQELKCHSMIQSPEPFLSPLPEVDIIEWKSVSDSMKLIHYTQQHALIDIFNGKL